jgi:hypothetical protein
VCRRGTQADSGFEDSVAEEAGEADSLLAGWRLHEPKDERNNLYNIVKTDAYFHNSKSVKPMLSIAFIKGDTDKRRIIMSPCPAG